MKTDSKSYRKKESEGDQFFETICPIIIIQSEIKEKEK